MYRRVCKQVYMCVGDDEGVRRNLVLIEVSGNCGSLFVRAVIVHVDNYRLVDSS